MSRRLVFEVAAGPAGERLDRFLPAALQEAGEPISRRRVRQLIERGAVYVDGKRTRVASRPVRAAGRVEIHLPLDGVDLVASSFELTPERVLHRDDDLIAVDKPSGLPTQATVDDAVDCLEAAVRRYLARDAGSGSAPYVALHHRLDRGTSGVMILATSRRANRGLARVFAEGEVEKVYQARVRVSPGRELPESWTVEDRLERVRDPRGYWRVASVAEGGRPATTDFRLLERSGDGASALVEARPRTGRMHQIRVHLADAGLPVLGDRRYGTRDSAAPRLMLHAASLALPHPVTGERLVVTSPPPAGFYRRGPSTG